MATEMLIKLHERLEERRSAARCQPRATPVHLRLVPEAQAVPSLAPQPSAAPLTERQSNATLPSAQKAAAIAEPRAREARAPAPPRKRARRGTVQGIHWQSAPHAALRKTAWHVPYRAAFARLGARALAWIQVDPFVQRLERLH